LHPCGMNPTVELMKILYYSIHFWHNTGEAVFNILNGFIIGNEIVWSERVCISTGGTLTISGNYNWLVTRIRAVMSYVKLTHC
jgi:hypothetical protein